MAETEHLEELCRIGKATKEQAVECNARIHEQEAKLTPDEVLDRLVVGNANYVRNQPGKPPLSAPQKEALTVTQKPLVAVLSCADSRVPVEQTFSMGPGDIFVTRNAGNVYCPVTAASLDYAVKHIGVKLLVVIGHQCCGAIKAAQLPADAIAGETPALAMLLTSIKKGLGPLPKFDDAAKHDRNAVCTNVLAQIKEMEANPVYSAKTKSGELKIVGAFYEIDSGKVEFI